MIPFYLKFVADVSQVAALQAMYGGVNDAPLMGFGVGELILVRWSAKYGAVEIPVADLTKLVPKFFCEVRFEPHPNAPFLPGVEYRPYRNRVNFDAILQWTRDTEAAGINV